MKNRIRGVKTAVDPFEQFALSQAIIVEPWIFVSGQAAIDDRGEIIGSTDFVAQAHASFCNLREVLEAAESSLDDVVKVTIFLTDMCYFGEVVALRRTYFNPPYPADSIVEVRALAMPELLFEIEAVAVRGAGKSKLN
ncbi:RidA family protein [Pseudomonas abyssi]|uniref:Enamine deaminase RidA n=1 Tax=Pseudomonas abyssi TaxID=170540 RepID=A0A395R0N7_9PSED|nr:RidA family protein [Halopseudomonas gallaeciensis]RGP53654.1 enamine deaminase RidA [Halopseudomonas gallaeciensis]